MIFIFMQWPRWARGASQLFKAAGRCVFRTRSYGLRQAYLPVRSILLKQLHAGNRPSGLRALCAAPCRSQMGIPTIIDKERGRISINEQGCDQPCSFAAILPRNFASECVVSSYVFAAALLVTARYSGLRALTASLAFGDTIDSTR